MCSDIEPCRYLSGVLLTWNCPASVSERVAKGGRRRYDLRAGLSGWIPQERALASAAVKAVHDGCIITGLVFSSSPGGLFTELVEETKSAGGTVVSWKSGATRRSTDSVGDEPSTCSAEEPLGDVVYSVITDERLHGMLVGKRPRSGSGSNLSVEEDEGRSLLARRGQMNAKS